MAVHAEDATKDAPDSFEAQAAAPIAAPTTDVAARRVQQGVFKSRSRRFGDRRPRPDHASLGIDEPEPYLINLPSQFDQKPEPPGAREKKGPFASTAVRFDGKNFMGKKVEKVAKNFAANVFNFDASTIDADLKQVQNDLDDRTRTMRMTRDHMQGRLGDLSAKLPLWKEKAMQELGIYTQLNRFAQLGDLREGESDDQGNSEFLTGEAWLPTSLCHRSPKSEVCC